jgi:protein-disulfide isomerase
MSDKEPKSYATDVRPPRGPEGAGSVTTGVAIIGFLLCFLAGSAVMWGYDSHRVRAAAHADDTRAAGGTWSDSDAPIPVSSEDPVWGRRDAPVTVVIFSDFQCPFCSRVEPTLEQVKATYGPDKVRLVWKNQPLQFHENAKPAAEAAQTVFALKGSDAFWKFHHLAFTNQKDLRPESYERWAKELGVDPAKFRAELATRKAAKKVDEDAAIAERIGATATPAFRVNGAELAGAQAFDKFKAVIDKELQKANAKVASGTARDRVYVETTKDNYKPKAAAARPEEPVQDTKTVWRVPVGTSPVLGKKDAIVTIVEFSDFQCPFCKKVEEPLQKVRAAYGEKVRFVWKHDPLPFHPRAEPASELALVARAERGDRGFWEAHDKLFAAQPKLEEADLERVAGELKLDWAKVKTAIKDKRYAREIEADVDAADDAKVEGTPHFFVNGRRLVGLNPFEAFQKVIDEEIGAFDAQSGASKVPASAWYDHLMKSAKGPPELEKKPVPAIPAGAPYKGAANAKVVIQEWSDFQCPFCGRVEGTLAEVMKNYGDKVKLVWRDKPLSMHADAPLAAEAAREALRQKGPDGFWKMHDKMIQNQQRLKREDLEGYAKEAGLDADKLRTALDARTHKPAVDADDKSANEVGLAGTPAFLDNGYFIDGALPYAKFKRVIDRALAEAK